MGRLARWSSLLFLAASLAACSSNSNNDTPTTPAGGTGTTGTAVVITITGMNGATSYSPNPARVTAGQTVTWHNSDSIAHTATQNANTFDTAAIAPGTSSSPVTIPAGTYGYHCSIHPSMVGELDVVP